jgi:hypothetical protein
VLPPDAFVKAATGSIQLSENLIYGCPVEILGAGQIVRPVGTGPYESLLPVGQMDTQGNYMLANGPSGNIFRNAHLTVNFERAKSPFARALQTKQRSLAYEGSEILQIREALTSKGVDGRGVKIMICEPRNMGSLRVLKNHIKAVTSIVQDRDWGVAPGARLETYLMKNGATRYYPAGDDPIQIRQDLVNNYAAMYTDLTRLIKNLQNRRDPALRVINLSWGQSRALCYSNLWAMLNALNPDGTYQFPHSRQWFVGNRPIALPFVSPVALPVTSIDEQQRHLMRRVDELLDRNPKVARVRQAYVDATREASENGIFLVVSAGNDHHKTFSSFVSKPGSEFNLLAESPYVISVAACNTNQTPGWRQNYRISNFSSRGDGHRYNPTIAAPGELLPLPSSFANLYPTHVANGTSYAAPWAAAVIALMLQENPNLTFDEVKKRMQQTAVNAGFGVHEQGAGILNPERAVFYNAAPTAETA